MKTRSFLTLLISAVVSMVFPACANRADTELLTGILSDAAAIVLTKNQKAVPVVRSLSLGIDAALTTGSLPNEKVLAFIHQIDKDASLTPGERLLIGRGIQRTHRRLVAIIGTPDLDVKDPRVRTVLEEIKRNLDDILALHDALKA